ncbi:MAG: hypothetical protein A2176_05190 [Spirochaetes bacterium RBG_13_51_14]|nr:MAG: hypothetical protein A2176_05190 [Spirochaetes bacterium RBG_13_51_14]
MHRSTLIGAALLCCSPAYAAEPIWSDPELSIQAEYRQDTLDYDDVEKKFCSEKARLSFGKSSASFTHVYINATGEHRFTWNLTISGIPPYFDCILGHYYANFGAGLLVGRKRALSSDQFSRRLIVSRGSPFLPCSSGNPLYSFHGAAAGFTVPVGGISLSVRGFVSFRNRFARNDAYAPDSTGNSFNSILGRLQKDFRYSEPVEINDYGSVVDLRISEHFFLQSYFLYAGIRRAVNRSFLWNYGDGGLPLGEKAFYCFGFFFQYRDDYITLFIELGFPNKVLSTPAGMTRSVRDFGILYGLTFRHRACELSFAGKNTGNNFYSPYSSGVSHAETACAIGIRIRPLPELCLGCGFFGEKKISSAANQSYLPSIIREQVFFKYGAARKGSVSARLSFVEQEKKTGIDRYIQIKSSAKIYAKKSVLFSFSGTAQRKGDGRYSGSINAGTSLCMLRYLTVTLFYSRFFIGRDNPLYTSISPRPNSITPGMLVKATSHMATCRLTARYHDVRISARYQHQFTGTGSRQYRIEVSAGCIL